jgi:hypothetical protein
VNAFQIILPIFSACVFGYLIWVEARDTGKRVIWRRLVSGSTALCLWNQFICISLHGWAFWLGVLCSLVLSYVIGICSIDDDDDDGDGRREPDPLKKTKEDPAIYGLLPGPSPA